MKIINAFFDLIALLIGADCDTYRQATAEGLCDFSGQGKE